MIAQFGPEDVLVRMQSTPNPMAFKFVANHALKIEGKATFHVVSECDHLPIVRDVLVLPGVKQVHLFQNTMTVTHGGELSTEDLKEMVEAIFKTRLPAHDPRFLAEDEKGTETKQTDRSHLSAFHREVEEILDRTIRPGLQADGGDVEVVSIEGEQINILYQGACGGCPSSMMGTLDAIQGILQTETGRSELKVRPV